MEKRGRGYPCHLLERAKDEAVNSEVTRQRHTRETRTKCIPFVRKFSSFKPKDRPNCQKTLVRFTKIISGSGGIAVEE